MILHDLLVSAGDISSIPFNPRVKWVVYFLNKKNRSSCFYSTLLSLSLNNSKRNSFELLLLNIFIFALSLDSYAILCVDNKDMPLFVYYIAMLLGVVCYHTHITQLCFSLCLLHTSLPLHVCVITFASFQRIWTM